MFCKKLESEPKIEKETIQAASERLEAIERRLQYLETIVDLRQRQWKQ